MVQSLGVGEGYSVGGKTFMSSLAAQSYARTLSGATSLRKTIRQTAPRPPVIGGGVDPGTMSALDRAIAFYREGGGFGKGVEAGIERGRVKAVAGGMQGLVSAGLAGTTMMGGLGKKYEEEVAMPARARVEETRAERISGLEVLKAQITQGATEAARVRALQLYLARLGTSTQLGMASMRGTSIAGTPTATRDYSGGENFYAQPRTSYGSVVGDAEPYQFKAAETIYGDPVARDIEGQPVGVRKTGIYSQTGGYIPFPERWS